MAKRRCRKVPDDTVRRDRSQFLALRRLQAHRRGKSYDDKQVIEHAGIEWERRQQAERRRHARTRSIDGRHANLAVPSFLEPLAQRELITMFFERIDVFLAEILKIRYLDGNSIKELADELGMSNGAARSAVQKALKAARQVPTR